ncbi:MAG: hypothetical protein PUH24_07190 [Prevotellaceae bacterium]|nr:hypothetical protein [Prevotella sp.]MDD7258032.1 hypothetical protein [Prevotellaceae bacterium]MDY6130538.1 hypothetical protein [Prevotella sp.]
MNIQKPLIQLYKVRSFGEKISDTFAFIGENFKILFKHITYFLLPLCLFQAFALNGLMGNYMALFTRFSDAGTAGNGLDSMGWDSLSGILMSLVAYVVLYTVGYTLLTSIIYAMMKVYERRGDRLKGIGWEELQPQMVRNLKRGSILILVTIILSIAVLALFALASYIAPALILVAYVPLIAVAVPLALFMPIYQFEDDATLWVALRKSLRLGFKTWGGIFSLLIVLSILASVLQMITQMPWQIAVMIKMFLGMEGAENAFISSFGYSFLVYLLSVVSSFGTYLAYSILVVGLGYQYGHACEKIDRMTVESDIDKFEQL